MKAADQSSSLNAIFKTTSQKIFIVSSRACGSTSISGLEFSAGGRYIDILAVDAQGSFVVVELKVSRGYDRVIGQLLRYMSWVEQNMETSKPVRGIIVAKEITNDLKLAASRISGVRLIEYEIEFKLRPV